MRWVGDMITGMGVSTVTVGDSYESAGWWWWCVVLLPVVVAW